MERSTCCWTQWVSISNSRQMRATSFPYQSPKGSFCCGNNGGSSRSVVHQRQFPKTAVIIIAAHTACLVVFCYNNIIQSPGKQWKRCFSLHNVPVQMTKTISCCYINSLFALALNESCWAGKVSSPCSPRGNTSNLIIKLKQQVTQNLLRIKTNLMKMEVQAQGMNVALTAPQLHTKTQAV